MRLAKRGIAITRSVPSGNPWSRDFDKDLPIGGFAAIDIAVVAPRTVGAKAANGFRELDATFCWLEALSDSRRCEPPRSIKD